MKETKKIPTPADLGRKIGKAIARGVRAEKKPWAWTGLDARGLDILLAAGIEPASKEWEIAESVAIATYSAELHDYIAANPERHS